MDTKVCQGCKQEKDINEYPLRKDRKNPVRRPYCNTCRNNTQRARYSHHKRTQPFKLKTNRAKTRAAALGVPFDLDSEYLKSIWTGVCPISGIQLRLETDRSDETAAELDRHIPSKGYTKGNVSFISRKMNRLKNSASLQDLEQLIEWVRKL